jgi:tRNA dimethylallyltransferase
MSWQLKDEVRKGRSKCATSRMWSMMSEEDQQINSKPKPSKPLVVIVGPTAVGKTELSLQLAERLGGEIISADSRLFYRYMDIGTAKPALVERERVVHHLIDVSDPDQTWSLAMFQEAARRAICDIHRGGCLPFLVGGTGQYIRAVIEEWDIPKVKPDPRLRQSLENWVGEIGPSALHDRLAVVDPQAAQSIDARNIRRTIRALEVILTSGKRFSSQVGKKVSPYDLLQVGLIRPRDQLYQRIDERIRGMLEAGLIEEVQRLLDRGYSPNLPTMTAIGYGEIVAYLQGEMSLAEAVTLIKRRTRIFVRRQANWFKRDDVNIHWFDLDQYSSQQESLTEIEALIQAWLHGE